MNLRLMLAVINPYSQINISTKMKKILMFIMISFAAMLAWSCSDDDDKDVPMSYEMLPKAAQEFVSTYYPGDRPVKVEREGSHASAAYEVVLASGHEVEFDAAGQWVSVDAPAQHSVPAGIVPEPIQEYVSTNFPAYLVNEITRNQRGYEVELTNGLDLQFDSAGIFIGHLD